MNNKQDVKDYNILLRIILFLGSILVYSCQSNIELDQKAYNNFSINGDSLTPHILIGDLQIGDSNYCYKIQLGDTIRLKSMTIHSSEQWMVGGKSIKGMNAQFVPDRLGIIKIFKLDEEGHPIAAKCCCVLKEINKKKVKNSSEKPKYIKAVSPIGIRDPNEANKSPIPREAKPKPISKFLKSETIEFEMKDCDTKEKSKFNSAKMNRSVRDGLFHYEFKEGGYRAFRLACNEKEISIEIEKYIGEMEVEYFLHEGKKQKDEADDYIRIKSIKLKEKDRLRLIDELNK